MQYDEPGGDQERFQSSYLVESRGELLLASVGVSIRAGGRGTRRWEDAAVGVWVKRDGRSFLADRVLFLGRPSSFAVEAARLGMDGGWAYFLDKRRLYQGSVVRDRCRQLKYSFRDGRSEFVEELPAQWTCMAGMWITPQPAIATSTVT
ncbi:unnamed protein product [Urochloa humidicola]